MKVESGFNFSRVKKAKNAKKSLARSRQGIEGMRPTGIEPVPTAHKTAVLPLNYGR